MFSYSFYVILEVRMAPHNSDKPKASCEVVQAWGSQQPHEGSGRDEHLAQGAGGVDR